MYWVIFLNIENKIINEKKKVRNFIIAVVLLLATYLVIIFLTENDKGFSNELPVSNMQNTENNNIEEILNDELYVIQNIFESEDSYEIDIYYPFTTDDELNSYINTKLDLYIIFKKITQYIL